MIIVDEIDWLTYYLAIILKALRKEIYFLRVIGTNELGVNSRLDALAKRGVEQVRFDQLSEVTNIGEHFSDPNDRCSSRVDALVSDSFLSRTRGEWPISSLQPEAVKIFTHRLVHYAQIHVSSKIETWIVDRGAPLEEKHLVITRSAASLFCPSLQETSSHTLTSPSACQNGDQHDSCRDYASHDTYPGDFACWTDHHAQCGIGKSWRGKDCSLLA